MVWGDLIGKNLLPKPSPVNDAAAALQPEGLPRRSHLTIGPGWPGQRLWRPARRDARRIPGAGCNGGVITQAGKRSTAVLCLIHLLVFDASRLVPPKRRHGHLSDGFKPVRRA